MKKCFKLLICGIICLNLLSAFSYSKSYGDERYKINNIPEGFKHEKDLDLFSNGNEMVQIAVQTRIASKESIDNFFATATSFKLLGVKLEIIRNKQLQSILFRRK